LERIGILIGVGNPVALMQFRFRAIALRAKDRYGLRFSS
jgi:hypothetical protein